MHRVLKRGGRAWKFGLLLFFLVRVGHADGTDEELSAASPACPDLDGVVQRIQARYEGIRDFSAAFEQISQSVVLAGSMPLAPALSLGEVVFVKPGRMRWQYHEPEPSLVVSNGKLLWIYDVAAKQVTRVPVDRGHLAGAALQFLLGEGKLTDAFKIEMAGCQGDRVVLNLLPRQPAGYERLSLGVESSTGLVTTTDTFDLFGNQTSLRFLAIQQNQNPDASIFEFVIPEGVELIEFQGLH